MTIRNTISLKTHSYRRRRIRRIRRRRRRRRRRRGLDQGPTQRNSTIHSNAPSIATCRSPYKNRAVHIYSTSFLPSLSLSFLYKQHSRGLFGIRLLCSSPPATHPITTHTSARTTQERSLHTLGNSGPYLMIRSVR